MKPWPICLGLFMFTACTETAREGNQNSQTKAQTISGFYPGYFHQPSSSRFFKEGIVGDFISEQSKLRRIEAKQGAASVNLVNGSYLSVPDANADVQRAEPIRSSKQHSEEVRAYFASLGLPLDQSNGVSITTTGVADPTTSPSQFSKHRLVSYASHIQRSIDGIPVVESYAWAEIMADGQIRGEGVHWPAIPTYIVEEAKAIKTCLEGGTCKPMVEEALAPLGGADAGSIRATIHHSIGTWNGEQEVFASWDVRVAHKGSKPTYVSFDRLGNRILPAHSRPSGESDSPKNAD